MHNTKNIWWIRHAPIETTGGYTGQSDVDAMIPDVTVLLDVPEDARWFVSPLKRARQTAKWLGKDSAEIAPAVLEQHFGVWEGRYYDEVWKEAEHAHDWSQPELIRPENGESFADVFARVKAWVEALPEGDYVVVAHAGSIRAALAHAMGLTVAEALTLSVDYCSISHVAYGGEKPQINYVNRPLI